MLKEKLDALDLREQIPALKGKWYYEDIKAAESEEKLQKFSFQMDVKYGDFVQSLQKQKKILKNSLQIMELNFTNSTATVQILLPFRNASKKLSKKQTVLIFS